MLLNKLGEFHFIKFDNPLSPNGAPEILRQDNEVIDRKGVNSTGVRRLGVKRPFFPMVSIADCESYLQACDVYHLYTQMTIYPELELTWRDIDYTRYGVRYVVKDVEAPDIQPVRNQIGGFLGSRETARLLRATWILQPVRYFPPEADP